MRAALRRTAARGYGSRHQKLRAAWRRRVNAGSEFCARCHGWIAPEGEPCARCRKPTREGGKAGHGLCGWDLGHEDQDRSRYTGPEHACCNRRTAAHRLIRKAPRLVRANWW